MDNIFNFLENMWMNKFNRFIYKLFSPVFLILEIITFRYYWNKIIIPELITNDKIFDFLDKNEFGFKRGRIIKKDLFDDNEFYDSLNLDEAKAKIKSEFVETITNLLSTETNIDIENYLTMIVLTDLKITKNQGEIYRNKVYTVYIQFCRYYFLMKCIKYTIIWISLLLISILSIYYGFKIIP